jgi:hypothetical protein
MRKDLITDSSVARFRGLGYSSHSSLGFRFSPTPGLYAFARSAGFGKLSFAVTCSDSIKV